MAAPKNNQFATKPDEEKLNVVTHVYTKKSERKLILNAVAGGNVSEWSREILVTAAKKKLNIQETDDE